MPVIALTQEMGSLAKDVALRLAQAGGLGVLRNEVVENVAGRMQVAPSLIRRLREGKAGMVERLGIDSREVALYTAEEVFAQAERGNVVLRGWGATCLLRPVQHVLRVRVTRTRTTCCTGRSRQVAPQPRSTTLPRSAWANTSSAV